MTHRDLVKQYKSLLTTYRRKVSHLKGLVKLPQYTEVKYERNTSEASIQRLKEKIAQIERLRLAARKKRAIARKIPSQADIEYQAIIDRLQAVVDGDMSVSMPFYNAQKRRFSGSGRRMSENNAIKIKDIVENALFQRLNSGMSESDAKREIVKTLKDVLGGIKVHYLLEKLAYGVYDKEYSRWGNRKFSETLERVRAALG